MSIDTDTVSALLFRTPMRDLIRGRITGRLGIDCLLRGSGLSGPASDKVRGVVKRTRLWRLEKVDVANELIAHFLDGQEAGTPIEELLEHFGDERQTAKLIRRAKKRQRPWAWHAFAWARMGVGVLFFVYLLMLGYFLLGSPEVKVNYVAQLNAKVLAVPESQRAWLLYRQALLELDMNRVIEWDTPIPYYGELPPEEQEEYADELEPPYRSSRYERICRSLRPSDPGWAETVKFLHDHADALALIREGAAKSDLGLAIGFYSDFDPQDRKALSMAEPKYAADDVDDTVDQGLGWVWQPPLGVLRQMVQLITADCYLAADKRDGERVSQDLTTMIGLAGHSHDVPSLSGEWVQVSILALSIQPITDAITDHPGLLSDDQLRDLAHRLASIDLSFEGGLAVERMAFQDTLQRIYTDDGEGDGRITPQGVLAMGYTQSRYWIGDDIAFPNDPFGPAALLTMASRKEASRMYEHLLDRSNIATNRPLWETTEVDVVEEEINNWSPEQRFRYKPITRFMPALVVMHRTAESIRGQREGVLIGISLELYRRDHDDWPESLEALTPGYLPQLPVDRFTGDPLHYRITSDGPVVYSIGVNGEDDGGRPPLDQDGKPDNHKAGPGYIWIPGKQDAEYDGDWVLWPMP